MIRTLRWLVLCCAAPAMAASPTADPLDSARWEDMRRSFFPDAEVRFDTRIEVRGPLTAENPMAVPVSIDTTALPDVREVLVFADFNPIVKVLTYTPGKAASRLSFRLKLQQSSPVRAAARTADGIWHVGGVWVNTTGGGCTVPSTGSASPEWQQRLGEVNGRIWTRKDGNRVRVRIIHPMDTGLAASIPAFYIETLDIDDADGASLMRIHAFEPVSENPLFTLDLPPGLDALSRIKVRGRDNNGNQIDAWVER